MQIKKSNGESIFVNDEEAYRNYLDLLIQKYQKLSEKRQLTKEEYAEVTEYMNWYNQIIDYQKELSEESLDNSPKSL